MEFWLRWLMGGESFPILPHPNPLPEGEGTWGKYPVCENPCPSVANFHAVENTERQEYNSL